MSNCLSSFLQGSFAAKKASGESPARYGRLSASCGTRPNMQKTETTDYDENSNLQHLKRYTAPISSSTAHLLDDLSYTYNSTKKNKLEKIGDAASNTAGYSAELDLPNQTNSSNYVYNSIGELVENKQEDRGYEYNAAGLVSRAYQLSTGSTLAEYTYNDKGLRYSKTSYSGGLFNVETEQLFYVYDAGGALVATYKKLVQVPGTVYALQAHTLYAAGRMGLLDAATGEALYELNDHVGNVRAVVKAGSSGAAETVSYTDYYPHGGIMPGRSYQSSLSFPYGYQGQEKDAITGLTNFELRQYDPRIGRWYNPDPYMQHHCPYLAMSNNPVSFTDPDGGWDGFGGGPNSDDAWRDHNFAQMSNPSNHFMNGDADAHINGLENMAVIKNAYNRYRAEHTNENGEWGNYVYGDDVRGGDEEHKHFELDESAKIVPTVYIYRVTTASDYNYKFEDSKTLSDKIIKQKIAPEVSRILNNNWLNTKINVKLITEEEAKLITSGFLRDNRSAIIPIVNGRDLSAPGSSIGQSTITKNGFVVTNPDETYVNYPAVLNFSRMLGLTKHYGSAYVIAHEVLHQLFGMSQVNFDPYKDHTNGWANLNRDGNEVSAKDFKIKSPFKSLKSMAEWIPFNMKQSINQWFKPILTP